MLITRVVGNPACARLTFVKEHAFPGRGESSDTLGGKPATTFRIQAATDGFAITCSQSPNRYGSRLSRASIARKISKLPTSMSGNIPDSCQRPSTLHSPLDVVAPILGWTG